ncbi:MAG: indolepyruvate ferredoxin oxidoreductase subunit alpha [Candidatus Thermoplasmatota archaeon]|nr:indolepyruvate ferredoxin oxidoreductase subunit alpha [Candidatus Thermoplasmatota archaeon]MCL5731717.1 indolepyruvate ferredoxin oxidoreductase subunit alpha [Candidatus Thermoplasmatota archaeon]
MKADRLLSKTSGEELLLLGNEAIARGVVEAGVRFAATYPGTPSSEVGESLASISDKAGIYFEYSINEKVAAEIAYGASISGLRSIVFMKHVGLNVASDVLNSINYTGIRGGMVIMTADDPSMYSSQNEQDNRHYAELTHLPMLEPSSPQEAKDFLIYAFDLSEKYSIPVIFRTTTRISHLRGIVKIGSVRNSDRTGKFVPDRNRFVALPSNSYRLKQELIHKEELLKGASSESPLNSIDASSSHTEIGIITSGAAYNVTYDAVKYTGIAADILKIGFTNPIPNHLITEFLQNHRMVLVSEELDPYLEAKVRNVAQINGIDTDIRGKIDGTFPFSHEYTQETVIRAISSATGSTHSLPEETLDQNLPPRPPVFCPGCPHRDMYYTVRRAVKMSGLKEVIYSSDIGCYSLGLYEPFGEADTMIEMGSSIGVGQGMALATGQTVISFIGDSTFFHSGIPSLINAYRNGSRMILIILDNGTTAMTGQEPNPGVPYDQEGKPARSVSMESIVKAIGIDNVAIVDPYDLKTSLKEVIAAIKRDGISVIIARRECAIIRDREMRKKHQVTLYTVDQEKCGLCYNCVENFACPAINLTDGKIVINPALCDGCGVCAEPYVCPFQAIKEVSQDVK